MFWMIITVPIALAAGTWIAGNLLPKNHVVSRSARYKSPPSALWNVITDHQSFPQWRTDIREVQVMLSDSSLPRWNEVSKHGNIRFETTESICPKKLVTKIADPTLPFGGSWTYELKDIGDYTELVITEHGEVRNPIFRLISAVIIGHTATLEQYLKDLGKKFERSQ